MYQTQHYQDTRKHGRISLICLVYIHSVSIKSDTRLVGGYSSHELIKQEYSCKLSELRLGHT